MNSNSAMHSSTIMPPLCRWTCLPFDYRRLHYTAHSYHKSDTDTQTQLKPDSTNTEWTTTQNNCKLLLLRELCSIKIGINGCQGTRQSPLNVPGHIVKQKPNISSLNTAACHCDDGSSEIIVLRMLKNFNCTWGEICLSVLQYIVICEWIMVKTISHKNIGLSSKEKNKYK